MTSMITQHLSKTPKRCFAMRLVLLLSASLLLLLLAGCSKDPDASQYDEQALLEAMRTHYKNYRSIPPGVPQSETQSARAMATNEVSKPNKRDQYPHFFVEAAAADIPNTLIWKNGAQLPDLGSPKAKKGGVYKSFLRDFPRTLRRVGPDSNGSFRPYILDWTTMGFAQRHPNKPVVENGEFQFFPGIAKVWALDQKNRTVYIKIDPEARWSDGEEITTDDVFFMFYFYQSKHIQAPWYNNFYNSTYEHVVRYDKHTFAVKLRVNKPDYAGHVLGLEPLPEHFFRAFGADYTERYQWQFVPTSGPYHIKPADLKKGRSITLTRNPHWWAKDKKFWRYRFNPDVIRFTVIRDINKGFEAFKKGDLEMFGLSLPEYWYQKLADVDPLVQSGYIEKKTFYNDRPRSRTGLWINSARRFLTDINIRQGIHFATNFALVIEKHLRNDYKRIQTFSEGFDGFASPHIKARPFNIRQALHYFALAGFKERGDDGILVNADGQRLSFTLTTGYQAFQDAMLILREEAFRAGIEFRVEVLDATAAWKKIQEKQHDIAFVGFGGGAEMYPRYWEFCHSVNAYDDAFLPNGSPNPERKLQTQTNNLLSIALPAMDSRIKAYRDSSQLDEMQRLAGEMEDIIFADASFIPGFTRPSFRLGHWRWVKFPDDFNVKIAASSTEFFLHWIDEDVKQATLKAKNTGKTFAPVIETYDQFCQGCAEE